MSDKPDPEAESQEDRPFDLVDLENADEIFSDGVARVMFGYPITRVMFYTQLAPSKKGQRERRKARVQITMPTATWLEFAAIINRLAASSGSDLVKFNHQQGQKIAKLLNTSTAAHIASLPMVTDSAQPAEAVNSEPKRRLNLKRKTP